MKYSLKLMILLLVLLVSCTNVVLPETEKINYGDPVITYSAEEITQTSALLSGHLNLDYYIPGAEIGFIFSTFSNPELGNGTKMESKLVNYNVNNRFYARAYGLIPGNTYYYKAFINVGTYWVGDIKSFTTDKFQFTAVDLGLSVKWANANLGADSLEGYGNYYAWGEIEPKSEYNWSTYQGWIDDAAHVILGGRWRMPTMNELDELIATRNNEGYQWEWKSINGHNGWLIIYLVNGNSIFLPAAGGRCDDNYSGLYRYPAGLYGFYWSSSLDPGSGGWYLDISSKSVFRHYLYQDCGISIRPVLE